MVLCLYVCISTAADRWGSGKAGHSQDRLRNTVRNQPAQPGPDSAVARHLLSAGLWEAGGDCDMCIPHPQRAPRTGEEPGGETRADGPLCKRSQQGGAGSGSRAPGRLAGQKLRSGPLWRSSIHLPTQGAWVQSLTQEGPTCDGETVSLCALEPELQDKRCHREEPAHRNRAESPSPQLEKRPEGPAQPKPNE